MIARINADTLKTTFCIASLRVLSLIFLIGFAGIPASAQSPSPSLALEEVCNDGIDNDMNGVVDRESPAKDGFTRYEFRMRMVTTCEIWECWTGENYHTYDSCLLTDTVQLLPGQDPTFTSEFPHCDGVGSVTVDGHVKKKGKLSFDISTYSFDAFTGKGSLCDGQLWNLSDPDKDWLKGWSGPYDVGGCDTSEVSGECKSYWIIDIVPAG